MMSEIYKFNGFNLDNAAQGYIVENCKWVGGVQTRDTIDPAGGVQGVFSSATFVSGRTVEITGLISADTQALLLTKIKTLKGIFSIDWSPVGEGAKEFYVQDQNGIEWVAQARVKDLPEFERNEFDARYQVTLFLSDARYRSKTINTVNGSEGVVSGAEIPAELPFELSEYAGTSVTVSSGNVESPLKITITPSAPIDSVIVIRNITTDRAFSFTLNADVGDVIIVDSGLTTNYPSLTKNGVSILSQKAPGSTWPSVLGTMEFSISDADAHNDFVTKYEFYDRLV